MHPFYSLTALSTTQESATTIYQLLGNHAKVN